MNRILIAFAAAACLVSSGCFKNRQKPADVPTVTSLEALSATNRAEVVRLILRGRPGPISEKDLADLPALKVLDISERGTKEVPPAVFNLKTLEHFYFVRNGLEKFPEALQGLSALTYLNLDGNAIAFLPDSAGAIKTLKWLRLNDNAIAEVPAALGQLKDLRRFYARNHTLKAVP